MSIVDKLRELLQIKSDIKDAIVSKGVEVDASLPFNQYPDKISEISGSESSTEYNLTENFYINGTLSKNNGIYSGFSKTNYIKSIFTEDIRNKILRFKFKINGTTSNTEQSITHDDLRYNLEYNNSDGSLFTWSWKDGKIITITNNVPLDTWIYVCMKFTGSSSVVRRDIYYSTEGFQTDTISCSADDSYYMSVKPTLGMDSLNDKFYLNGEIDMRETCITDLNNNVIRAYCIKPSIEKVVQMTQAQYDELPEKDPDILYVIVG